MIDWVHININKDLPKLKSQSPVIKCLLSPEENNTIFESWLKDGLPQNLTPEEQKKIIADRIELVVSWRKELNKKFSNNINEKEFCIFALAHLIAAHYSGKAQSFSAIGYTLSKLSNAVASHKPIIFTFCFGGYKNHNSISYPEIDWAELFHLNYLFSYLYPIIKNYKYGVELEYESEEISIQFNNVPQESTNKYTKSFKSLLNYYIKQAELKYGISLSLRLVIAREQYEDINKLYKLIEEKKPYYISYFEKELSKDIQSKWIQRAESNYMWKNGIKNYSELTDTEKYKILLNARITNEAFLEADYELRQNWFEQDNRIPLTGTWGRMPSAQPIDGWLHLKSTESSVTDCWIGTGCLELKINNGHPEYIESILSKSQMDKITNRIFYEENSDDELKKISSNFNRVPIFYRKENDV